MAEIDIRGILSLLPHRPPMLLVDRVLDFTPGEVLTAIKNVTVNEPCFQGHFPGQPVLPGVLIIEALAQAATLLAYLSAEQDPRPLLLFAGIENARFKRVVVPGDQVLLEVRPMPSNRGLHRAACVASVEGRRVCSAELLSMVSPARARP